jgi:hypothetical protein
MFLFCKFTTTNLREVFIFAVADEKLLTPYKGTLDEMHCNNVVHIW